MARDRKAGPGTIYSGSGPRLGKQISWGTN